MDPNCSVRRDGGIAPWKHRPDNRPSMDPNCSVRRDSAFPTLLGVCHANHQWIQIALYAETRRGSLRRGPARASHQWIQIALYAETKRVCSAVESIPTIKGYKLLCSQRLQRRVRTSRGTINGSKLLCSQRPCVRIALTWCRLWKV